MGIEVALMTAAVGLGVAQGVSGYQQNKKQAQATVAEGTMRAEQLARTAKQTALQTARLASKQKTSFLSSGLALEGSPFDVFSYTLESGKLDLAAIQQDIYSTESLYNQRAKNYMSAGRSAMLSGLASGVSSAAMIGYGAGMFSGSASAGSLANPGIVSSPTGLQSGGGLAYTL